MHISFLLKLNRAKDLRASLSRQQKKVYFLRESMSFCASPTVLSSCAFSSEISTPKDSSRLRMSSTKSSESASRSSLKAAPSVT